jgi:hypothetical protein
MLFKVKDDGALLTFVMLANSEARQPPNVVVFREYDPEQKCLGKAQWMPYAEWADLLFADHRTKREAADKAAPWFVLMLLAILCLLWVPELLILDRYKGIVAKYNWSFMMEFFVGSAVIVLFALYKWYRAQRRWAVDL